MTPQELKANAIKFLGHMMTRPEVLAEVQQAAEPGPAPGKDAAAIGAIMAKHLNIPQPTIDEVRQMGKHIQDATAKVKEALDEHAPEQATTFSPSAFFFT